jgi:hypothetical protein
MKPRTMTANSERPRLKTDYSVLAKRTVTMVDTGPEYEFEPVTVMLTSS